MASCSACDSHPSKGPALSVPGAGCIERSVGDMKVGSSTEVKVKSSDITGSAFMPDGRLVLADCDNKKLLLLDKDFHQISELLLSSNPFNVAVTSDSDVIVTLPRERTLQYVSVGVKLRADRRITTDKSCWGVVVHEDDVYVSVHDGLGGNGEVQVLDRGGAVRRRVGVDADGRGVFLFPDYIAVSTGGLLYVADSVADTVYCYSSAGDVVYCVGDMECPRGLLAFSGGQLLVCCWGSSNVRVLADDGCRRRVLLSSRDGLVGLRSISYRNSDGTLVVTMINDDGPSILAYVDGKLSVDTSKSSDAAEHPIVFCDSNPSKGPALSVPGAGCIERSVGDMKVGSSMEVKVKSCDIPGSAFMPDGRLVLADYENSKLLLLDNDFHQLSELLLSSQPFNVAVTSDSDVIVTLPNEKMLQYVSVGVKLRADRRITTDKECWGVVVPVDDVYVSVYDDPGGNGEVQVLDRGGAVMRRVGVDAGGRGVFYAPDYIAVSTGGLLYVADYGTDSVYCYSSAGDVVYRMEDMKGPRGLLAVSGGQLLVCCVDTSKVHVLADDCSRRRELLSSRDGLVDLRSISYRNSDGTLIVTMYNLSGPSVLAFKLI